VNANLAVLTGGEEQVASTPADGMNAYFEERMLEPVSVDTLQPVAHTTNMLEERVVHPKDKVQHISIPLFQVPRRHHGGQQDDHTGHWPLPEAQEASHGSQPTKSQPAERGTWRGKAVSQPVLEKFPDLSDKTELSIEYRWLAPSNVIANSQADMAAAMLSEQEQEQYRSSQGHVASSNLHAILNRQNEITSMLLKQQQLSTLPPKSVPVFDGDILQLRSFMGSFDHNIEMKTDNGQDRLFYLEQYTKGQTRDHVRRCQHMDVQGYLRVTSEQSICYMNIMAMSINFPLPTLKRFLTGLP